jgi:DNA gyrase subunit A
MATSIPPHNLSEVCDALIFMLRSWSRVDDISVAELQRHIQGPDFPTGGLILDPAGSEEGLSAAYGTGRGKITVRARAHVEGMERGRTRLLVTELPYQVNKAGLLERIADLVRDGGLEGVADLRDESDRQGMRIVIELSRTADPRAVLRELYKRTPMETTFSIILLALVRGEPRMLSLKQALRVFLDHRLEVIRKRSDFDLARARERAHLLEGLRVALKNLEEVIRLIRAAKDGDEARAKLQKRFRLSEIQANAILDMPLRRLAALEREKIELEYKEKVALIKQLEKLLASPRLNGQH